MKRLLSSISVAELAEGTAGAFAGKMLADLGAEVMKVERPGGDLLRRDPRAAMSPDGTRRSGAFVHLNTNKRSVVLDSDSTLDRARLLGLLANVDLVIESRTHGNLAQYGIDADQLLEDVPALSIVHISGFGATGPYADYESSDLVAQAFSMSLYPVPGSPPLKLPYHLAECMVGHCAALGGLGAVTSASNGEAGQFIDCSSVEALASQPRNVSFLLGHQYSGFLQSSVSASGSLFPIGLFPCADGHVAMMSTPQQLGEMLTVLDNEALTAAFAHPEALTRPETKEALDAALYPWLFSHTRAEITAAAQAAGWPLAGVNTPREVLDADHLHQRGYWIHSNDPVLGPIDLPGPPARHGEAGHQLRRPAPLLDDAADDVASAPEATATRTGAPRAAATPPLSGVRVVDFTTVWAGPFATQLLGDLGAEVIRVENPFVLPPTTKGYSARPPQDLMSLGALGSMYGPIAEGRDDRPWNRHAMNNALSRNKLSMTVDTRKAEGREIVMRLVEESDVFIDNFKLSGLDALGITISDLQRRNPRLVITRMAPAGLVGDWASYTGFGAQFDGLSGLASMCGHPGSDPETTPSTTYMDAASGPAAAFATVAALRHRDATGRGMVVDLSQIENVIQHLGDVFVDLQLGIEPARIGNRDPLMAPQGVYPCRGDGQWIAISATDDAAWAALTIAMDRPDLSDGTSFGDAADRYSHHDELDDLLSAWTGSQDKYELFHALQGVGVAAAPVPDEAEFTADPHLRHRGWLAPLRSDDVGVHLHPGPPYRSRAGVWRHGSPTLGADNAYVYKTVLGVSDENYEQLRAEHHIAVDYLDRDGNPY